MYDSIIGFTFKNKSELLISINQLFRQQFLEILSNSAFFKLKNVINYVYLARFVEFDW